MRCAKAARAFRIEDAVNEALRRLLNKTEATNRQLQLGTKNFLGQTRAHALEQLDLITLLVEKRG